MSKKIRSKPPIPRCALCNCEINILETDYVVGTSGRFACRECLKTAFHVLEIPRKEEVAVPTTPITPQYIIRELEKAVIGQEKAKEAVALAIWKQLLHHRDKWISPQIDSVLKFCMEKEFQK